MSFAAVTAAKSIDPHTYAVDFSPKWCIGSVPNGGYVVSVLLSVAKLHFESTLEHLGQPDLLSSNFQFLRRTNTGAGTVTVRHIKLGASISTIHVTLEQQSRVKIEGYILRYNSLSQDGLSLQTFRGLSPAPLPVDHVELSKQGEDDNWCIDRHPPWEDFRKITKNFIFHHPKRGPSGPHSAHPPPDPTLVDEWLLFRPNGELENFITESLGVVVDNFPHTADLLERAHTKDTAREAKWYPTVSLNIDVKRPLPPGGVKWLFVRAQTLEIVKGKMDIQIMVLDDAGNLIALCSHVTLILSADRNTKESSSVKL